MKSNAVAIRLLLHVHNVMLARLSLALILMGWIFSIAEIKAQSYLTTNGFVQFESHASKLTVKGVSRQLHGLINFDTGLVDFYLDLATIRTGITLRDKHMRESFLETKEYPFAEFTGQLTIIPDFNKEGIQEIKTRGKFTIHGVTRDIEVDGTLEKTADGYHLKAKWEVRLEDHNIMRPQLLFLELSEEQKVSIDVLLLPFDDDDNDK